MNGVWKFCKLNANGPAGTRAGTINPAGRVVWARRGSLRAAPGRSWACPRTWLLVGVMGLAGCALPDPVPEQDTRLAPRAWQQAGGTGAVADGWLKDFGSPGLEALVAHALEGNHALAQQAVQVTRAQQAVVIAGGARRPRADLSLARERHFDDRLARNSASAAVAVGFDLDPWRRLSAAERQAELTLAVERSAYQAARLQLAAEVCQAWFNLQEAEALLALSGQRLQNLQANLEIIEQRYNTGLASALDLYLARNNLEVERAQMAAREETRGGRARALEQLLGDAYPGGALAAGGALPVAPPIPAAGLPSELLTRRPDLQAAWLRLLAAHAGLAVAYKNRFPSLRLTGRLQGSSTELTGLLDNGLWSLAGAAGQVLFDSGALKAEEERARQEMWRVERVWLEQVYAAFAEVENALQANHSAMMQYEHYQHARDNAEQAEKLSFERYQRGLENYTTVLEAERSAFDARARLIQLQNQLLQSRVALSLALGGDYTVEAAE